MLVFIHIHILRFFLFWYFGVRAPITYISPRKFRKVGGSIKYDTSKIEPILHATSGKVLYYKTHYHTVTLTVFSKGFVIDYWIGDSLYTFHGSQCSRFGFWGQLGIVSAFFVGISQIVLKNPAKIV